jgi:hypothetical protein
LAEPGPATDDPGARVRWWDRAPHGWDELLAADPAGSPAHRPALWAAFAAAFPGHELRVATLEEDGELVGGAPVLIERRGPFAWLHALPRMLPGTPLARPGRHAEVDVAIARALAMLARELGAVGGTWSLYRPEGPAPDPGAIDAVPGETRWIEAAIVDLEDGLDAAEARMSRKQRQALRHARTHGLAFREDPRGLEAACAMHLAQGREWGGDRRLPLELSRRLLAGHGEEPVARLFTLADARGPVSAALALDGPHETFVWWSGTHADGRRRGAFGLLLWRIAEWAHARGRRRLDLGASTGLEAVAFFKHGMGASTVRYPLRWLDASRAAPAGRAVAALQAFVRRGRARGEAS